MIANRVLCLIVLFCLRGEIENGDCMQVTTLSDHKPNIHTLDTTFIYTDVTIRQLLVIN